jgi:hypothetical protein
VAAMITPQNRLPGTARQFLAGLVLLLRPARS